MTAERYHATVRARPSRSAVFASKPNSSRRARRVEAPARLAVRHRGVPDDLAREAGRLGDQLGQLADRGLDAGAEVHRLGAVVALGGEDEPVDAVVDVEELAASAMPSPQSTTSSASSRRIFRISAGITCDVSRSKLSRGP